MKTLVKFMTVCQECSSTRFYLDTKNAMNVQCKSCGKHSNVNDLFHGYMDISEYDEAEDNSNGQ